MDLTRSRIPPGSTLPTSFSTPSNVAACVGGPASFTVTPSGGGTYTYQWRKGGINIGGATSATLNIPAVVPGDVGNYDCVVTNACGNKLYSSQASTRSLFHTKPRSWIPTSLNDS